MDCVFCFLCFVFCLLCFTCVFGLCLYSSFLLFGLLGCWFALCALRLFVVCFHFGFVFDYGCVFCFLPVLVLVLCLFDLRVCLLLFAVMFLVVV